MTRLREALDRAQQRRTDSAEQTPSIAVPDEWQFEAAPSSAPTEPEISAPGDDEPLSRFATIVSESGDRDVEESEIHYPFLSAETADKLVVGDKVETVFVEQYRRLVAALHHAQLKTGARTVMITSAVESEGKTLTAANIALTLSHSYQRNVLLVDADLRRPSVHEVFKLSNRAGLGDTLGILPPEGKLPVKQVSPHLWIMTAGRPNPDPMGGLVSDTMKEFLIEAMESFDWVVVDTPPVALLTDANLLASMIDLALIVVSARSTPYPLVKRAIDAIGAAKVLGVVLNRADPGEASEGLAYGYGYGYSYAPRQEKKPARSGWRFPWGRKSA